MLKMHFSAMNAEERDGRPRDGQVRLLEARADLAAGCLLFVGSVHDGEGSLPVPSPLQRLALLQGRGRGAAREQEQAEERRGR